MRPQHLDTAEELDRIAQREWDTANQIILRTGIDTGRCPECDGGGIAVEWDLETMVRREVWCECGAEVKGRFVCAWCRGILEESKAPGQTSGICPPCGEMFTAMGKESDG